MGAIADTYASRAYAGNTGDEDGGMLGGTTVTAQTALLNNRRHIPGHLETAHREEPRTVQQPAPRIVTAALEAEEGTTPVMRLRGPTPPTGLGMG